MSEESAHALPPLQALEPQVEGLVTIIVPTHNRADLLQRAVESALAQRGAAVEVIVVSDGSTDDTDARMRASCAAHDNLRFLELDPPAGACAARNLALCHARGQYVTPLDDDDALAPDHVAAMLAAYRPDYAAVGSSQLVFYPDRKVESSVDAGIVTLDGLLHYNKLAIHVLTERDRMLALGGFDPAMPALQDYDLAVRLLARYGPALKLDNPSYHVHMEHEHQRISDPERRARGLRIFVERHGHLMRPAHRRSMELLEIKHSGERLGLRTALRLLHRDNAKSVLSMLVNSRAPWAQRLYHRLLARPRG